MTRIEYLKAQLVAIHQQRMENDAEYRQLQLEQDAEREERDYDHLVDQSNELYYLGSF